MTLHFDDLVAPTTILVTFQGGFVGTKCAIQGLVETTSKEWIEVMRIFPEDVSRRQSFPFESRDVRAIRALKFVFEESSDFFGRITIYDIDVLG